MSNHIDIIVRITIAAPPSRCFDYIVPIELSHIFQPYLLLPGVKRTDEAERWFTPGLARTVYFTDGTKAKEELLTVESPHSFTYKISDFTGINKFLVSHINGAWQFSQDSDGATNIEWTYSLACHNTAAQLLASVVVAPMLRRYLQRALEIIQWDMITKQQQEQGE